MNINSRYLLRLPAAVATPATAKATRSPHSPDSVKSTLQATSFYTSVACNCNIAPFPASHRNKSCWEQPLPNSLRPLHDVVFDLETLKAPPARDSDTSEVMAGQQLFIQIKCAGCHHPEMRTGISPVAGFQLGMAS